MKGTEKIIVVVVVVALIAIVGWIFFDSQRTETVTTEVSEVEGEDIVSADQEPVEDTSEASHEGVNASYEGQEIISGLGRFTITIPDGWTQLFRPMDSDWLFMEEGTKQPVYSPGEQVSIQDLDSWAGDGPRVFMVWILDTAAAPKGEASAFTLPNNGQPISGTKYVSEGEVGPFVVSEKEYTYQFELKDGKELVVWYTVYEKDPTDQSDLIDKVVRSIVVEN